MFALCSLTYFYVFDSCVSYIYVNCIYAVSLGKRHLVIYYLFVILFVPCTVLDVLDLFLIYIYIYYIQCLL